jgi:hypothetical protein
MMTGLPPAARSLGSRLNPGGTCGLIDDSQARPTVMVVDRLTAHLPSRRLRREFG